MIDRTTAAIAIITVVFGIATVSSAEEMQRQMTGPNGQTSTQTLQGSCPPGSRSCSSTNQVTGPNGNTTTGNRQSTCVSGQGCSGSEQFSGPNGNSGNVNRQFNRDR